ncbi:hypothetical protein JCM30471_08230 [Desulfuromonas carbonis]
MSIKLTDLEAKVEELNQKYPRPNMPPLALSEFVWVRDQSVSWPNCGQAGVYFLFDENKELLYIGKTSCNSNIGRRIGAHFSCDGSPRLEWLTNVKFVKSIGLPEGRGFEAPAIEEFLIQALNPILNVSGRTE